MLAALWAAAPTGAATVQVGSVNGDTVTLVFDGAGPKVGSSGRVCRNETVGAKSLRVCVATVTVSSVARDEAKAKIAKGRPEDVQSGDEVEIEVAAPDPNRADARDRGRQTAPTDPLALARAGDRAIASQQWAPAIAAFKELLRQVPGDPHATRQLERAEQGAREAAFRAEIRQRRLANAGKVAYLEESLARASAAGDRESEISYASMLLEIDPLYGPANAVRERERGAAAKAAQAAMDTWNPAAVEAAWAPFATAWAEPLAAQDSLDQLRLRTAALFAPLGQRECGELAALLNAIQPNVFSIPALAAGALDALAATQCPHLPLEAEEIGAPVALATLVLVDEAAPGGALALRLAPQNTREETAFQIDRSALGSGRYPVILAAGATITITVTGDVKDSRKALARWSGSLKPGETLHLCVRSPNAFRRAFSSDHTLTVCEGANAN